MAKFCPKFPLLTQDTSKSWTSWYNRISGSAEAPLQTSCLTWLENPRGAENLRWSSDWISWGLSLIWRESADIFQLSKIGLNFSRVFTCEFSLFMQCIYLDLSNTWTITLLSTGISVIFTETNRHRWLCPACFHCKKVAGCSAETNSRGFEGDDYRSRSCSWDAMKIFPPFLHSLKRWGHERNAGYIVG